MENGAFSYLIISKRRSFYLLEKIWYGIKSCSNKHVAMILQHNLQHFGGLNSFKSPYFSTKSRLYKWLLSKNVILLNTAVVIFQHDHLVTMDGPGEMLQISHYSEFSFLHNNLRIRHLYLSGITKIYENVLQKWRICFEK